MPSVTVAMKSYLWRDSVNDGEEGVTGEINKCASVTVTIKSYRERDSGNDGEEVVTSEINKYAECDSDDEKSP